MQQQQVAHAVFPPFPLAAGLLAAPSVSWSPHGSSVTRRNFATDSAKLRQQDC
jgi:hypothetical protein